ncbi:phenylacetate--CoA ligase family protein [Persicobacter psychrovividus]|uniref:Phenylacetate--CoA ligase n=1 Tax=Persicobacter psychrovividus TaxID=387638 RepID=A0ABM7VM81_9BACT|nr:phenylacetate--CoA ligase [Persicobacter psychrovividus]
MNTKKNNPNWNIPSAHYNSDHWKRDQLASLQESLRFIFEYSPFYKQRLGEQQLPLGFLQQISDLQKFPVTTKEDLQLHNEDFFCVEKHLIRDFCTTSGTLGEPVNFGQTEADLERLSENERLTYLSAGVTLHDVVQLTTTMDKRFMAGHAYYLGARNLGVPFIRCGMAPVSLQLDTIARFGTTVLISVPSFILKLIQYAKDENINLSETTVKKIICIGEPVRDQYFELNTLGKLIHDQWDVELYSTYASTEMATAFTECKHSKGGHLFPELIHIEILDKNDQPVEEGQPGEVCITTIGVEAMPLIRFKTGDIAILHTETCDCGRTTPRLSPIIGRKKHLLKFKGTSIYPNSIYNVLNRFEDIDDYIIEVCCSEIGQDLVRILLENTPKVIALQYHIKQTLQSELRVLPEIVYINKSEIRKMKYPKNSRKPVTFIDLR